MTRKPAFGYLYISPLLIGVLLFSIYPVIQVVWMSFHDIELANLREAIFVGLQNYKRVFTTEDPTFLNVTGITFAFVGGSVILHVGIGLGLAVLLNIPWLKGRNVFRNVYMIPWITAGIMVGYTWSFLFEPRAGILNYLLTLVNLPSQSWTADLKLALPSIIIANVWRGVPYSLILQTAIIANVWRGVPYSLILQTAGLQSINTELYDAAVVDGANPMQILTRITIPLIREFILLNLILDTGMTFHVFDTIFAMTAGGPLHRTETFSINMYLRAFKFGEIGMGSAIAMMLLIISLVLAVVYMRFFRPGRE
jgi:ABC-type sugar transport system permease subunit